jgi:hypothetical protein
MERQLATMENSSYWNSLKTSWLAMMLITGSIRNITSKSIRPSERFGFQELRRRWTKELGHPPTENLSFNKYVGPCVHRFLTFLCTARQKNATLGKRAPNTTRIGNIDPETLEENRLKRCGPLHETVKERCTTATRNITIYVQDHKSTMFNAQRRRVSQISKRCVKSSVFL